MADNDIVIHPMMTKKDRPIPETGILLVNPGEAHDGLTKLLEAGGSRYFFHNSKLGVSRDVSFFLAGPCIGAPVASMVMEKLIALGGKKIILMGWCGAVDDGYTIGDIVIPDGAVSGEGTSVYYSTGKQAGPDIHLGESLCHAFEQENVTVKRGRIWSTDAPYRESRKYLQDLNRSKKVVAVDMEFSALCSVARFRNIQFGAVLIVSDEVWRERWKPGFKHPEFQNNKRLVFEKLLSGELF